jgi:hypothetical protein
MTIVGCDLHTRKQQVAVLQTDTAKWRSRNCSTREMPWSSSSSRHADRPQDLASPQHRNHQ